MGFALQGTLGKVLLGHFYAVDSDKQQNHNIDGLRIQLQRSDADFSLWATVHNPQTPLELCGTLFNGHAMNRFSGIFPNINRCKLYQSKL